MFTAPSLSNGCDQCLFQLFLCPPLASPHLYPRVGLVSLSAVKHGIFVNEVLY